MGTNRKLRGLAMAPAARPVVDSDRYWRTVRRKLGESCDLGGKALVATGAAAILAPLATKGAITFPSAWVLGVLALGIAFSLLGVHLQAKAKPDE
jgi:hypothetical protein